MKIVSVDPQRRKEIEKAKIETILPSLHTEKKMNVCRSQNMAGKLGERIDIGVWYL